LLIETTGLTKKYPGVLALNGVDFNLKRGEVHVLFGENGAGKSTLISILAGAITPSDGKITVEGEVAHFDTVAEAQAHGIFTVFQEFSLIPTLTAAQNIFLGWEPKFGPFINHREMRERSRELFEELGFDINPDEIVARLSRGQQQMVEITKAFHGDLSTLILDEPTASLTDQEVDHLFDFIKSLQARGVGIIYISHRIQEFVRIADRVTVLRDGAKIGTVSMKETDDNALLEMMTGRVISEIYPKINHNPGAEILRVNDLKTSGVEGVSFSVRAGEILGVAGLVGSGKSRLFRAIMGLTGKQSGSVYFNNLNISALPTRKIIKMGMYYLSPDRKTEGLDLAKTATENLAVNLIMGGLASGPAGFINWDAITLESGKIADRVELSSSYRMKPVSQLSGGNQQKVLFAKCFGQDVDLYIFDEPTVGVDMGTRVALYLIIKQLAEAGKAVIVISSDLPEVMNLAHRLIVLSRGHISAELSGDDIEEDQVLKYFFEENGTEQ